MYGMGPGPGGFGGPGPMGGPHGGPGHGPGHMGPGPMGHMGPMHRGFFFFPFFRGRKTGNSTGMNDDHKAKTRTVTTTRGDGKVITSIEYVNEEFEKKQKSIFGRFLLWLENLTN